MSDTQDKTRGGAGWRKSTPAGRKGRTSPTRKSSRTGDKAPPAARAAAERPLLRAVGSEPVPSPAGVAQAEDAAAPVPAGDDAPDARFRRSDLTEAVSRRTALKRADAKVVLELVLDELGKALDANDELVLAPLGKLMVRNRKPDASGPAMLTVKIRRPRATGEKGGESPLADPDEDG